MNHWPHAPIHVLGTDGCYLLTAATYQKELIFKGADALDHLQDRLLSILGERAWHVEAWAIFPNHYHVLIQATPISQPLPAVIKQLHTETARWINSRDQAPGRKVWFNYWDSKLTFPRSYLARLAYVHQNPVRHGLVSVASHYRWCSAAWFEQTATPAKVRTIYGMKWDKIQVLDDF